MIFRALLLGLSLAHAGSPPTPAQALAKSAGHPDAAFSAELTVTRFGPKGPAVKKVKLLSAPSGAFRREVLGGGTLLRLIVSDGKVERLYDPARKTVWEGEAADPLFKRLGPDEELERLSANYEASVETGAPVAGRPTWLLELSPRSSHQARRRLWLDREADLVLKSQHFRPDGSVASEMRFETLKLGAQPSASDFAFTAPEGVKTVKRLEPDFLAIEEARASGVTPRLPAWLPPGFVFESLDVLPRGKRSVIHYRFSDGVDVLSLFQCPPRVRLGFGDHPRRRVKVGSGLGTASWTQEGAVLGWHSRGERFILVAPLPEETLQKVAESLK